MAALTAVYVRRRYPLSPFKRSCRTCATLCGFRDAPPVDVGCWPVSDLRFRPPDVCYWGKLRKDVWAASPSVGHAPVSGKDPRPEPPLTGVSAHSGNDRYRPSFLRVTGRATRASLPGATRHISDAPCRSAAPPPCRFPRRDRAQ